MKNQQAGRGWTGGNRKDEIKIQPGFMVRSKPAGGDSKGVAKDQGNTSAND
jgi:hypothetical protein